MSSPSKKGKKIYVGLSGGVDSSVAAALLKREGHDVTGVFIKVWQPDFLACTWPEDRMDAMRVCAHLEIPFITYDLEQEYKQHVVDYMIHEYAAGRTPNPDVMCNTHIKFDAFLKHALNDGAEYIATGHYVRSESSNSRYRLLSAADENKDQSYFLWGLTQEALAHCLFPIGVHIKSEVRALARDFGLPTATKRDSQGLCFLGKLDMREFLTHFVEEKSGEVLDQKGTVIGRHHGAIFYTIGQRHGFTVQQSDGVPHYVIAKNMSDNTIVVSPNERFAQVAPDTKSIALSQVNWISGTPPQVGTVYMARTRYRQELRPCVLLKADGKVAVVSFQEEKPTAPSGQSLVLYHDDPNTQGLEMLGGGIID